MAHDFLSNLLPPKSLKGHIVLFSLGGWRKAKEAADGNHVLQVSHIEQEYVYGTFIASEIINETSYHTHIRRLLITNYQILTRRELPLLIGYKYTTDILAELIKGSDD